MASAQGRPLKHLLRNMGNALSGEGKHGGDRPLHAQHLRPWQVGSRAFQPGDQQLLPTLTRL